MELGERAQPLEEPLDQLLERLQPRLKRIIANYRVPVEDAEDVLQQSLLAFVHKRQTIHNYETWLVGTVRKQCLMYLRSRRRRLYDAVDAAVLELVAKPQQPGQEQAALACDLDAAIAQIPHRCRSLLRLRYRLGYKPGEVAEEMGYSPSSIRKVTSRCIAALTRQMISSGFRKESGRG